MHLPGPAQALEGAVPLPPGSLHSTGKVGLLRRQKARYYDDEGEEEAEVKDARSDDQGEASIERLKLTSDRHDGHSDHARAGHDCSAPAA